MPPLPGNRAEEPIDLTDSVVEADGQTSQRTTSGPSVITLSDTEEDIIYVSSTTIPPSAHPRSGPTTSTTTSRYAPPIPENDVQLVSERSRYRDTSYYTEDDYSSSSEFSTRQNTPHTDAHHSMFTTLLQMGLTVSPGDILSPLFRQFYGPTVGIHRRVNNPYHSDIHHRPAPPPLPRPPSPILPDGFDDSPKEDEVYVCSNCGTELCTGKNDIQQQVWVTRQCGHVYCGTCAKYRAKTKRPAGMPLPPPFRECVVNGCSASCISSHSMFQIFM